MPVKIVRLPANRVGRDFVVGDLHGQLDLFEQALHAVRLDPARDRLFSVGDLTDRGPDSEGCLALVIRPYVHAVMGNHEDMLVRAHRDGPRSSAAHDLAYNGGLWYTYHRGENGLVTGELQDLIAAAAELPHLLVVGEAGRRFHIVHAELDPATTDADIDAGLPGASPADLLWTRNIMLAAPNQLPRSASGLSPTFCGHTPSPTVRHRLSHICLDTGATFERGELTVAELRHGELRCLHTFPSSSG